MSQYPDPVEVDRGAIAWLARRRLSNQPLCTSTRLKGENRKLPQGEPAGFRRAEA